MSCFLSESIIDIVTRIGEYVGYIVLYPIAELQYHSEFQIWKAWEGLPVHPAPWYMINKVEKSRMPCCLSALILQNRNAVIWELLYITEISMALSAFPNMARISYLICPRLKRLPDYIFFNLQRSWNRPPVTVTDLDCSSQAGQVWIGSMPHIINLVCRCMQSTRYFPTS